MHAPLRGRAGHTVEAARPNVKSSTVNFVGCILALILALAGSSLTLAPACAAASAWVKNANSDSRLVAAPVDHAGPGKLTAGVEIRLGAGWKTYWKNPGDSGVPPSFDWSGSENLSHAEVLYPAPDKFDEAGGVAYGYEDEVVFPVLVTPKDASKPVALKLQLDYGLCKDLCIPAEAKLALTLTPSATADAATTALLDSALAAVPRPAAQGKLPAITKISAELDKAKPELVIDASFPPDSKRADLFVEAADDYVPPAKPEAGAEAGKRRFVVSFPERKLAEALKGKRLTFTLVGDDGARQSEWTME
jgi:DsbC/DsbD-like thiol-disulfide interchange protein